MQIDVFERAIGNLFATHLRETRIALAKVDAKATGQGASGGSGHALTQADEVEDHARKASTEGLELFARLSRQDRK